MGRSRTERGRIDWVGTRTRRRDCLSHGQYGQQKIGLVLPAGVKRVRAGKQFSRTIGRVIVSEPSDAPKWTGRPRSLEVLALNCERQTRPPGQRQTHRPDFEVNLVDLAWLERLAFVMRIIGEVFGGSPRIQFALRDS